MARKQTGVAIWTCDRCGRTAEGRTTHSLPSGWSIFETKFSRDVCDICCAAFEKWWKSGKKDTDDVDPG